MKTTPMLQYKRFVNGSMLLSKFSIHAWIAEHGIKNEKGEPINFRDHPFLFDIYCERSQKLVIMKAAQVGMSTLEVLKNLYDAKHKKMDIIYTLPTDADVSVFVGGKVNRIIAANPILLEYTRDKDSVEQKQVGESMIYFRGTWTQKAAIMVTADRLVHDEKDSSKPDVISNYQARLQHSKYKQIHTFSHPSAVGMGVDVEWQKSDQKHWFVRCTSCNKQQYLSWSLTDPTEMSIDLTRKMFVCKHCGGEITDSDRRKGKWVARFKDREYAGYWVPLLICPWVTAKEIIDKYNDPGVDEEFFYNKVLGLPYVGADNKLTSDKLFKNLTPDTLTPSDNERVIIGVDTGLKIDYVLGTDKGLFMHGDCTDYDTLDAFMKRWKKAIVVMDAGGDLIGARKFQERWKGRVYLCYFREDRKTQQLVDWGKNLERGRVTADRNRMIQLVVSEFIKGDIALQGNEGDWHEYWLDWNNLTRIKEYHPVTNQLKGTKWVRNGRDHRALATVYWRIGVFRFGKGTAAMIGGGLKLPEKRAPEISPMNTVPGPDAKYLLPKQFTPDWRRS